MLNRDKRDQFGIRTLLTEEETARYLNKKRGTLRRDRWAGSGPPFIRLPGGRSIRYDLQELNAWIDSGRRTSTSDDGIEGKAR